MAYFEIALMNTRFVGCSSTEIPLWYQVPVGHFFHGLSIPLYLQKISNNLVVKAEVLHSQTLSRMTGKIHSFKMTEKMFTRITKSEIFQIKKPKSLSIRAEMLHQGLLVKRQILHL